MMIEFPSLASRHNLPYDGWKGMDVRVFLLVQPEWREEEEKCELCSVLLFSSLCPSLNGRCHCHSPLDDAVATPH